jgi:hypothetical protein
MVASYRHTGKLDQDLTGTETIAMSDSTANLFSIIMAANEEETAGEDKALADEEVTGECPSCAKVATPMICPYRKRIYILDGRT